MVEEGANSVTDHVKQLTKRFDKFEKDTRGEIEATRAEIRGVNNLVSLLASTVRTIGDQMQNQHLALEANNRQSRLQNLLTMACAEQYEWRLRLLGTVSEEEKLEARQRIAETTEDIANIQKDIRDLNNNVTDLLGASLRTALPPPADATTPAQAIPHPITPDPAPPVINTPQPAQDVPTDMSDAPTHNTTKTTTSAPQPRLCETTSAGKKTSKRARAPDDHVIAMARGSTSSARLSTRSRRPLSMDTDAMTMTPADPHPVSSSPITQNPLPLIEMITRRDPKPGDNPLRAVIATSSHIPSHAPTQPDMRSSLSGLLCYILAIISSLLRLICHPLFILVLLLVLADTSFALSFQDSTPPTLVIYA
jgi:hypothetical protein